MKNNKKGFTLMEMLIVVAIIAVLVAIAIPVMSTTLEKSREAVDAANLRATYAELAVQVLEDGEAHKDDVTATQTQKDWQNSSITNIAGVKVANITVSDKCTGWTVAVAADGTVTFTEKTSE